ncbi:MAG: hypothetical protein LLF94_03760 [Chlamydiales bacterium]|nr:hypothetical protein [Chlamydiales bacterium]
MSSVNVNSISYTLNLLRQQQSLQKDTPKVTTSTVQVQTQEPILPTTTENSVVSSWSRVNTLLTEKINFRKIVAEQQVDSFFETSGELKTDARKELLVNHLLANEKNKLTVEVLKELETPKVAKQDLSEWDFYAESKSASPESGSGGISAVLSWSSKRMSQLMNWRNTESQAESPKVRNIVAIAKKAITEVALPFITVSSIVESLATKLLSLGARVIKRDATHLNAVRKSAMFTIFWSTVTLYHNVKEKVLEVDENAARESAIKKYTKV